MITDSWGRAWRHGQIEVAIGCAGLAPLADWRGAADRDGRAIAASVIAIADEVAAAADLVRGKDSGEPAVRVRGLENYVTEEAGPGAAALVRPPEPERTCPSRHDVRPQRAGRQVLLSSMPGLTFVSRALRRALGPQPLVEAPARLLDPLAVRERPRRRAPSAAPARLAPSGVSAYSTRGGTSGCTRRPTRPSRSIARSVWVSTFSEIGSRSAEQLVVAAGAVAEREQHVDRPLRGQQAERVVDQPAGAGALGAAPRGHR